ncbi:MAG: NAD(P)-dependent oxidoreductase [Dongiaceae bacterium]
MTSSAGAKIGFVGIGNMGWPMAARLAGAGHALCAYDSRADRAAEFATAFGGGPATSLAALAAASDIVVTILPTSDQVEQVLFGAGDKLSANLCPGTIVIDMTSGQPARTIALGERLAALGVGMIDAPVSGGVARAETGDLAIMTGGAEETIARCLPLLELMGSTIMRTGLLGSGQAMKALNNLVSAGGFLIGIEALLIGKRFGLDPATMVDVLNASSGSNNSTQKKFKQFVLSQRYDSGFALALMAKDLGIALELAQQAGMDVPFAAQCRELWAEAAASLGAEADHTELARAAERRAKSSLSE